MSFNFPAWALTHPKIVGTVPAPAPVTAISKSEAPKAKGGRPKGSKNKGKP